MNTKATSLKQAIKREMEYREANYDYDYDDRPTEDECLEGLMDECGRNLDGSCDLAGTEYCDWECPFG